MCLFAFYRPFTILALSYLVISVHFNYLEVICKRGTISLRIQSIYRIYLFSITQRVDQCKSCILIGSFRCGKNCATCPYISHGLTTYTFFSTEETRSIKLNLTCETKNLIYMIQCNRCNLQYIGETKRRLKDRFNEHRRTIDNPNNKSKSTTAAEHFLSSPNHIANDMILIPIEKIFSNRDSIRKAREAFLIQKGRTIDPDGLNIREETY